MAPPLKAGDVPSAKVQLNGEGLKPIQPIEMAFTLPSSPDTKIHLHIMDLANSLTIFLASATAGGPSPVTTLGSLVYALPNRGNPSAQPLSTTLYHRASSVDFANRLAKILARKVDKPVYVGGEVSFWVQEDEALAMRGCVDVVVEAVRGRVAPGGVV